MDYYFKGWNMKIPYIENYANIKFYGGIYYDVMKRDSYKCKLCGSTEFLNVHHIIGFRPEFNKSFSINSMVTLCRKCHSKEHSYPHLIINDSILETIGFDFSLYSLICEISNNKGNKKLNKVYK
jgi:hypothetical protein